MRAFCISINAQSMIVYCLSPSRRLPEAAKTLQGGDGAHHGGFLFTFFPLHNWLLHYDMYQSIRVHTVKHLARAPLGPVALWCTVAKTTFAWSAQCSSCVQACEFSHFHWKCGFLPCFRRNWSRRRPVFSSHSALHTDSSSLSIPSIALSVCHHCLTVPGS